MDGYNRNYRIIRNLVVCISSNLALLVCRLTVFVLWPAFALFLCQLVFSTQLKNFPLFTRQFALISLFAHFEASHDRSLKVVTGFLRFLVRRNTVG